MSAKEAKLAVTPPVVGFVNTAIYSPPFELNFSIAADVLAICISEKMPSCILAPPDAQYIINGSFFLSASSTAAVIFSPTTRPILAMKKRLSITASTHLMPSMLAIPVITASFMLVLLTALLYFSSYSGNSIGLENLSFLFVSINEPLSIM